MFNLIIDIGNTTTKLAVFQGRELCFFERYSNFGKADLEAVWHKFPIQKYSVSSVKSEIKNVLSFFPQHMQYCAFHTGLRGNVVSAYNTMDTLGLDRWAKVVAVNQLYPQRDALIIDMGTCITFDILEAEGIYRGGSISLGVAMRFKALAHYTGKLPSIDWDGKSAEFPGNSTEDSIRAGVLVGIKQEILGYIAEISAKKPNLLIFLTGGDADFLKEQLKNSIFASQLVQDPHLVVKGINEAINFEYVQKL
ncbi:MAG: type III pantothenate kinase [Pedobacter sp.]|nr:MAG: type III pantothenate kinase [Pedobacter sp.]